MRKIKTAISIDDELIGEADTLAQELDIPRSRVVALALEEYIRRYRNRQLLTQINEAYEDEPDAEDTANLEIIRSHRRKSGAHDEWK